MKKLLLLLLSCFGVFSADYAERGTNFTGYSASTTISNQANAYVLVYDGGYSSGSRTRSISVTNFLALAPGGTLRANGTIVATPNLTNSTYLSVVVDGSNIYFYPTNLTAAHLATDSVSADELNATGVESELEAVLELSDLQGAVTDAQVPNNITVDLATLATTATTANSGDSATAFFSSGEIEDARLPSALTRDSEIVGAILNPNLIASLNTQTPEFSGTSGTNMIPSTNNLITWDGTQAGRSWVFNLSGSSDPGWLFSDGVVQMTNHLRFGADNTWDIGASGATRPRNLFLAGSGTFGGALTLGTSIFFGVNAALTPMSSGVLRITDGSFADFGRLTLGGTSASYPALKRSGTSLHVRLADDSAFTGIAAGTLTLTPAAADTTALAISGGSTTGSGTTPGGTFSHTANTSGNIDGVWKFVLIDTASGSGTDILSIFGGASGTAELFKVDKLGHITTAANIISTGGHLIVAGNITASGSGSGVYLGAAADAILKREAAAILQMGDDAASPINQTLKANDGVGTDKAGANLTHAGGQGTGTGRGGALIGKTAPSGTTGSSANAYSERYHFPAKAVTLTESTATTIATIAVPAAKYLGGNCVVTVFASDATDHQSRTLTFPFSAINKAGTVTAGLGTPVESVAVSAGTLTATITAVANGNAVDLKVDATSSLTQTTLSAKVALTAINSNDTAAVTEI